MTTREILIRTKNTAGLMASLSADDKNTMLYSMAEALLRHTQDILSANQEDVEAARGRISDVMLDRLSLDEKRIAGMADGIRAIASLPDPIGKDITSITRPNGLVIRRRRSPIGLVAIIFESRPNVASDAACLSLKSGNVCVLRGGKEAYNSCSAIVEAMKEGIRRAGICEDVLNLVSDTTRASANELMTSDGLVDLLIPRGGAGLIKACVENATVPCIQTGTGICHIFVDESADQNMALSVIENAKTSRPSVCNAEEVLLVHERIASEFLPKIRGRLVDDRTNAGKVPVELRLCEKSSKVIAGTPASDTDFDTEFLDYILAVKVVSSLDEAICHIAAHSTGHSEAILTQNKDNADRFTREVDSAAVYVNASTRFTDGGEFGLGCEMGISTQKLHARGPMGLEALTTYKYIIEGNGQIR